MGKEVILGADNLHYCKACGEAVERVISFPICDGNGTEELRTVTVRCRCDREEKEAIEKRFKYEEEQRQINMLKQFSLMDARLKDIRFSNYKLTADNEKVFTLAKRYVDKFDAMFEKGQGLLFWGDVGTGKSYTAAMIANELLNSQVPVIMTSFIKLLKEVGESDYIERLNKAKLLIIDDLGAERSTDYALEKVYDIIDSRYRSSKPIVLTTNLTLQEMKDCEDIRFNRIYDRIFEMCYPIKVVGKSWRKKEAVSRFEEMKKMLEE